MQFRSLLMRQSFGNPSSHHHLSLFSHRICLALFSLLAWIKLSRSFPGRRLNPTFAAVWVRLSGPHRPGCKHDVTLVCLQIILAGAAPHFISWVTSQMNGGSCGRRWGCVVYVLNKADGARQSNVCEPSFSLDYVSFNEARRKGSRDSDILLCRITFTKTGNTTLRMIFIVSYIYDHIISWLHLFKHTWEEI